MKKISFFTIILFFSNFTFAQVSSYTWTASSGTYTPISGGTVLISGAFDDGISAAITIPTFLYNCTAYTSIKVNYNGHIAFGNYTSSTNYTPISGTVNASGGIVSALGRDLASATSGAPEIRHELVGSEYVIQWKDVRRSGTAGEVLNFQIRLNTSDNTIAIVYGTCTPGANSIYPEVGLKGVNNSQFKNLTLACAAGGWLGATNGGASNATMCLNSAPGTAPASGTTFTFTAPGAPATPGTISGSTSVCSGATSLTYSVSAVAGATSYNWTVPAGATITSGSGTNAITVTMGSTAGNISVTATNNCGTSAASNTAITINSAPSAPLSITGASSACAGAANVPFSVLPVAGATSYNWTLPTGSSVASGTGTNSILAAIGATSGTVTVSATNACGTSSPVVTSLVVLTAPATPGSITGSTSVCSGTTGLTYSVSAVAGATTYNWTVPAGATITAGSGTNSITVSMGAAAGNISVTATNSCGTSSASSTAITLGSTPATPGSITGTTAVCSGATGLTYSVASVAGATSYNWTVPAGATITSGAGTNSITVSMGSTAGTISVTATNSCGTSSASNATITINTAPSAPLSITGASSACAGAANVPFSVLPVAGATSYNWTLPTGSSVASGTGTNSILAAIGTTSGTVTVSATNACGTSSPVVTSLVVLTAPATPGSISGSTSVCTGTTGLVYSVSAVAGATSYNWTVPAGASITSGSGTNTITVSMGSATGNISVTATNSCGTSSASSTLITVGESPATPGTISGSTSVCSGATGLTYSVGAVAGATSYNWTVPAGATITSGSGTNSISVSMGSTAGTISVTATNSCGTSAASNTAITINSAPSSPGSITGASSACAGDANVPFSVLPVAGATSYNWTLPTGSSVASGTGTNSILAAIGTTSGTVTVSATNACGTSSPVVTSLVVNPLPTVSAGADQVVCEYNFPVTITATGTAQSYSWSNGSTAATTTITQAGTYTVTGSLNGCSSDDQIVITSDPCAGLEELDVYFRIYPNPAVTVLNLETNISDATIWSVVSLDGRVAKTGMINTGMTTLDISHLANGKYFLNVGGQFMQFEVIR